MADHGDDASRVRERGVWFDDDVSELRVLNPSRRKHDDEEEVKEEEKEEEEENDDDEAAVS